MADDNWKHRSAGMVCATCMWFAEKGAHKEDAQSEGRRAFGRCRRHAPTLSGYPAVYGSDWCGDHKLDENKI